MGKWKTASVSPGTSSGASSSTGAGWRREARLAKTRKAREAACKVACAPPIMYVSPGGTVHEWVDACVGAVSSAPRASPEAASEVAGEWMDQLVTNIDAMQI